MKRIFICILGLMLSHTTTILCMDDSNKGDVIVSPPPTPRTPRTPHQECACRLLARHCRLHPTERPFDDADHPLKSPIDLPRTGEIPSPKSASPSKLSPKTIAGTTLVTQSSDAASQSTDANNTQK